MAELVEEGLGVVGGGQEGLDLGSCVGIVGAGFLQEGSPLGGGKRLRSLE